MRTAATVIVLGALGQVGCGSAPADSGADPTGGAGCGTPTTWDLTLLVKVTDAAGAPLAGIDVVLEDRGWTYEDLGAAVTDAAGVATVAAVGVTDVPDCWGTVLNYVAVAEDAAGVWSAGEKGVNTWLYNAIADGSLAADTTDFPIALEVAP